VANYGTDVLADISDDLRPSDNRLDAIFHAEDTNTDIPRRLRLNAGLSLDGRESLDTCLVAESESGRSRPSTRRDQRGRATETMTVASRRRPPSSLRQEAQDLRQFHRGLGRSHARQPQVKGAKAHREGGRRRGPR
jgi:hypothetical protein